MTATLLARGAYAATGPIGTPRATEYDAFARITGALARAAEATREGHDFPALVRALHDNRRLWTLLAADVAGAANALPEALRARIFWLAEFTTEHTRRVLAGDAAAAPLVEINCAVMRGLRPGAAA